MWRIIWLIRDFGETLKHTRRLEEEIIPKQLVDLVRQAQAGQSFETEWNISGLPKRAAPACGYAQIG